MMMNKAMSLCGMILVGSLMLLLICGCTGKSSPLQIGIIGPSIDHLPLSYKVAKQPDKAGNPHLISFSSGWEAQEALVAGRLDAAIIPFTYAWNGVAMGYPLKIVSFLERETDGVIVLSEKKDLDDLAKAKIGLLKASTLEILYESWSRRTGIHYTPVYFRSPNEMIAALRAGDVAGIVCYEPLISKLDGEVKVVHWFSGDFPRHPCCDIVINSSKCTGKKIGELKKLITEMQTEIKEIDARTSGVMSYLKKRYGLSSAQASSTLDNSLFITGLCRSGIEFEKNMSLISLDMGYQKRQVKESEIYLDIMQ